MKWVLLANLQFAAAAAAASSSASVADLRRAVTKVPGDKYKGDSFEHMNVVLNGHLKKMRGLTTVACSNFTAQQLQEDVLAPIFEHADPSLLTIYSGNADNRLRSAAGLQEERAEWARLSAITGARAELEAIRRDGLCHEAVMWFVHHLTQPKRRELGAKLLLPLLPEKRHEINDMASVDDSHKEIHANYETKVSCQQCHAGPVWKSWVDATLPKPLPVDTVHPGRERQRSCDYQNEPPCGPCEGLGGPRWGDSPEEFDPVNCSLLALPIDVPESDRPRPAFPSMGHASIDGDTRSPLCVRPDPKKPGKYPKVNSSISLAWDGTMRRHRYDFQDMPPFHQPMTNLFLQTEQQAKDGSSAGAMVTIVGTSKHTPDICLCIDSIAGNMDIDAFVPHSPHDPLDLPAAEGGLNYLGRIKMQLDGGDGRTVIADHYMKWAFHFLVDAEKGSPSYGMPLRLYGATGVRMIYSKWTTTDPRASDPKAFKMPRLCVPTSKTCLQMRSMDSEEELVV